jgi:hypothetical protein
VRFLLLLAGVAGLSDVLQDQTEEGRADAAAGEQQAHAPYQAVGLRGERAVLAADDEGHEQAECAQQRDRRRGGQRVEGAAEGGEAVGGE